MVGLNLTSRCVLAALAGRMNAGAMGVMDGSSSCGVCGKCGDMGDWRSTSVSGFGKAWDISGVVGERTRLWGVATASGRERLRAATGAAYPGLGAARGMGCRGGERTFFGSSKGFVLLGALAPCKY